MNDTTADIGASGARTYLDLPVAELTDHPANLRFDLGDVSELAASITELGYPAGDVEQTVMSTWPSRSDDGADL